MKIKLQEFIQNIIKTFEAENEAENMWRTPLVTVLSAKNPLLPTLKQIVSNDHLLPEEILPGAKSIIVFFVPFEDRIIKSNTIGIAASRDWAYAYVVTNKLLAFISDEIEKLLNQYNRIETKIPASPKSGNGFRVGKIQATHNFDKKTLLSRWSHRHIAWIAGLGTFGINNMLITSKGCCGRLTSLVTDAECDIFTESSDASNKPITEKCLNKKFNLCGRCHKKCPIGSYDVLGEFNRNRCYEICLDNAELYKDIGITDVCGKCLVGLPCSSEDPSQKIRK